MNPLKTNLVALGSAAVIAVYGAGFARTRAAAQRFAGADAERRPAVQSSPRAPKSDSVAPTTTPTPSVRAAASAAQPAAKRGDLASTPKPASPPARDSSRTQAANPSVDSTAKRDSARMGYKDGIYTGWGTSRHGDIEAEVEVKDGKIVVAWIKQCLTQYSCSWLSKLPPQVVDRQSPEVDFVSGATQSVNAFYYAVVQALSRAQ